MLKILPFALLLAFFSSALNAQVIQTTFLSQYFQGSGIPAGWTQTTHATDGGWKFGFNTQLQSVNFQLPAHTKFACTNDDACNCNKSSDRLIADTLDLSTATAVVVKFDYYYVAIQEVATVEVSTDSGATWYIADTLHASGSAWATQLVNITAWAVGHSKVLVSFKYNDGGTFGYGLAIDNVIIYQPGAADAQLSAITPVAYQTASYGVAGSNIAVGGTIKNLGASDITSCYIKWTDGTNTYSDTFTSVVPVAGSINFTHNHLYPVPASGTHPIKVWVELANDTIHANDTLTTVITSAAFAPVHKLTIEDQTICSSGNGYYSARGIVFKDSFARGIYANDAELISVHAADPMIDSLYANGAATFLGSTLAWPQIQPDRKEVDDPIHIFDQFYKHIGDFAFADIEIHLTYDSNSRVLQVIADTHFAVDISIATGRYNLALVLTEDSVHSNDTSYSQNNAYSGGIAHGPLSGAGIDFAAQPPFVSGRLMYYMNVARNISGSYAGINGSIPVTVSSGTTLPYSFPNDTIPVGYNASRMKAIVLLISKTTGQIANANGEWLMPQLSTSIGQTMDKTNAVKVFPNPFTGETNLLFRLNKPEEVSVSITSMLGETVSGFNNQLMSSGEHNLTINGENLASGIYLVTLKAGNTIVTKRVVLNR